MNNHYGFLSLKGKVCMAVMGRPRKEINQENFESLCKLQCTVEEIAGFFKCDADTINAWCKRTYGETFSAVYKKHSQDGKISLRRYQFRLAERNSAMAIWLGKQYLGQRDHQIISLGEDDSKQAMAKYLEVVANGVDKDTGERIGEDKEQV